MKEKTLDELTIEVQEERAKKKINAKLKTLELMSEKLENAIQEVDRLDRLLKEISAAPLEDFDTDTVEGRSHYKKQLIA